MAQVSSCVDDVVAQYRERDWCCNVARSSRGRESVRREDQIRRSWGFVLACAQLVVRDGTTITKHNQQLSVALTAQGSKPRDVVR